MFLETHETAFNTVYDDVFENYTFLFTQVYWNKSGDVDKETKGNVFLRKRFNGHERKDKVKETK